MTGAEALAALLAFAATAAPEIVEQLKALIDALRQAHPSLVAPPPEDGEAKVDAEADAAITARFVGDPIPLDDEETPQ